MQSEKRYLTVYEQVREDIIGGRYPVGTKLPSKRVMAEAMDMSVITIEHAYELLAEEGYIVPRQKSGYFVSFDDSDIYVGAEKSFSTAGNRIRRLKNSEGYASGFREKTADDQNKRNEPGLSYSIYAKTVRKVLSDFDDYIMQKPYPGEDCFDNGKSKKCAGVVTLEYNERPSSMTLLPVP